MANHLRMLVVVVGVACLGAASVEAQCPDPANVVGNCGFESGSTGWTEVQGTLIVEAVDPRTGVNSGRAVADAGGAFTISSDCFSLSASTEYGYNAYYLLVSGTAPSCRTTLVEYSGSCGTVINGTNSFEYTPTGSYQQAPASTATTSASTDSGTITVTCAGDATSQVRVDDVYVGAGLIPVELQSFSID